MLEHWNLKRSEVCMIQDDGCKEDAGASVVCVECGSEVQGQFPNSRTIAQSKITDTLQIQVCNVITFVLLLSFQRLSLQAFTVNEDFLHETATCVPKKGVSTSCAWSNVHQYGGILG